MFEANPQNFFSSPYDPDEIRITILLLKNWWSNVMAMTYFAGVKGQQQMQSIIRQQCT